MALGEITSHMTFLSRNELYQKEKPYSADFPVDDIEGAKINNHTYDVLPITLHDARVATQSFTLDREGFCYIKAKTTLHAEDATNERTEVMDLYTKELINVIRKNFPQYHDIKFMDFQVRLPFIFI